MNDDAYELARRFATTGVKVSELRERGLINDGPLEPAPDIDQLTYLALRATVLGHLAAMEGDWLNASWVRMYAKREPGCLGTLRALDELQAEGLIEPYGLDLPFGDPRRLEDDYRATKAGLAAAGTDDA